MPTIAAMIPDPGAAQLVREQIGSRAVVRECNTVEGMRELITAGGLDAVVSDLWDASGASVPRLLDACRHLPPHVPVVLYFAPTPAALRLVPDLIASGRGIHLVLRNHEHLGLALAPLLDPPRVPSAADTLARHLVPIVPVPFRPFVAVSALKASPRLRVGTVAGWSGQSRRTLERALRHAGLPGAGTILGACTALHAAWWLDVQGWSAKQVVTEMRFSHTSALSRALQRYCGCTVRALREAGGFQELLAEFEGILLGMSALSGGR